MIDIGYDTTQGDGVTRVDPNAVGVVYIKNTAMTLDQKAARFFDPASIQPFETRDGNMRMWSSPDKVFYNMHKLRHMNQYPGMFK